MNAQNLPAGVTPADLGSDDDRPIPTLADWWYADPEGYNETCATECAHLVADVIDEGLSSSYPGAGYAKVTDMIDRMRKVLKGQIDGDAGWFVKWRSAKSEENAE